MPRTLLLLLVLTLGLPAWAQSEEDSDPDAAARTKRAAAENDSQPPGSVAGVVTRASDQTPLRRVRVMLYPFELRGPNVFDGGSSDLYSVETDATGRFTMPKVRPGKYWLSLARPGHIWLDDRTRGQSRGRMPLVLEPGQKQEALRFAMSAGGVIAGTIFDAEGEPARFATVNALRLTRSGGKRRFVKVRTVEANDIGEYRLYDLRPGLYFVSAQGANPLRALMTDQTEENMLMLAAMFEPKVAESGQVETVPRVVPTYFPGTPDAALAAAVNLVEGEQARADFTVLSVAPGRISGRVANLGPNQWPQVMIQKKGSRGRGEEAFFLEGEMPPRARVENDGRFTINGVPPGEYRLNAFAMDAEPRQPSADSRVYRDPKIYIGRLEVTVASGADLQGVEIPLREQTVLRGRVTVEGMAPRKPREGFPVSLEVVSDGEDGWRLPVNIESDGALTVHVTPEAVGTLRFQMHTQRRAEPEARYYLKSARAGGIDVLENGLPLDAAGSGVEIIVGNKPGSLEVLVVGHEKEGKKQPAGGVTAVIFPADRLQHRHRYAKTITDQYGKAQFKGLAPGEYYVVAWEQDPDAQDKHVFEDNVPSSYDSLRDAEFMKPHVAKLVKVSVKEGQSYQATVGVIAAETEDAANQ